jgi:hypothetical protein
METQPFLKKMFDALGKVDEQPASPVVTENAEPAPEPIVESKQDSIIVQVMGTDMSDSYYNVGHKDLIDFTRKFNSGEYGYNVGGLFGSEVKVVNEGRPMWVEAFLSIAKPAKKGKKAYFIDSTDPKETIGEVSNRLRVTYPDLIIGF